MVRRKSLVTVLAIGAAGVLTACGGSSSSSDSASPSESQSPPAAPVNAAAVVTGMEAAGAPIALTVTYTEATDLNDLLGRPGQYTSKAAFSDTQVKGASGASKGDVELGGGVECFANNTDTQKRAEYVATVTQSSPLFAEYDFVAGGCLLRVSHYLTPTQASKVADAFSKVMGGPAVSVTPPPGL